MADKMPHEDLLAAFEARYDYLSARTLLIEALHTAELEPKAEYTRPELNQLVAALQAGYPGSDKIVERINTYGQEPVLPVEPVAEIVPEPEKKDEKKDEKKEDKKDEKKEDKKDEKKK